MTNIAAEKIEIEITKLNIKYKSGELRVSHNEYLKMYTSLARKYKKLTKRKTLSDYMKEAGVKSTTDGAPGFYKYYGKNFTVAYHEDACETVFWTVDAYALEDEHYKYFESFNQYSTKKECLRAIFQYDMSL